MSSIDLEDLVATLDTHHIGSEALDLANLQAQLQQALQTHAQAAPFPTSPVQTAYCHPGGAPANTPTARTPSGWGQFADASSARRRRSSSTASARSRGRQVIREEDEDHWRCSDANRSDMDQDMMEDVEEEAQVDASLYSTTSPLSYSRPPISPAYGNSPTTYTTSDPFLAAQLQAAEQRSRQPSFFAQYATAQQHTSPFYAAPQSQQPQTQSGFFVPSSQSQPRSVPHSLTIDTGPRFTSVDAGRLR